METQQQTIKWYKGCLIACYVILLLCTAWLFIAMLNGSVVLYNALPANIFDYQGDWLIYIFAPIAFICFIVGIVMAIKGLFSTDVKTYEVSSSGTRETADGCMMQIMGVLLTPVLFAALGYAAIYYLIYLIVEVGVTFLPYIVGLILLAIATFFLFAVWNNLDRIKLPLFIGLQVMMIGLYVTATFFLSGNVNVSDKVIQAINEPEVKQKTFTITPTGIGSLQLGQVFKDMSDSDEGLYNRVKKHEWTSLEYEMVSLDLYWDKELVARATIPDYTMKIESITIYSKRVVLPQGFYLGMPMKEAVEKGADLRIIFDEIEETGYYAFTEKDSYYLLSNKDWDITPDLFATGVWERIEKEIATYDNSSNKLKPNDIISDDFTLSSVRMGSYWIEFYAP